MTTTCRYELIDTEGANVLGSYETEDAALRDVAEEIAAFGPQAPEVLSLALIRLDVPAAEGLVASGATLVARAQEMAARGRLTHAWTG